MFDADHIWGNLIQKFIAHFNGHWSMVLDANLLILYYFQVEWDEIIAKLGKLESDCKASWDYLRAIIKHDSNSNFKNK